MILNGKVALITGASRGIGAATAVTLAKHGAAVAVNYFKSKEAASEVVAKITDAGGRAIAVPADARDAAQVSEMVSKTVAELGPIDILVLNAGMPVPRKPFVELSREEFDTKVIGELHCFYSALKEVIPGMIEGGNGSIIGISSGLSRRPGFGFSAHSTAKSGIDGLMKSLALELGPHGIRVNTVAPGLTRTDATAWMSEQRLAEVAQTTPLRRVGEAEDVAEAVLLLASPHSRFITGAYVPVSGGSLMP